jgi:beta-glucosidase
LTGVVAAQTVTGIQDQGVIATAKHFVLNDQELNRLTESSDADDRTLHEIYLWPFARAVEAGVGSVMCSYNKLNSTYACENDYTLNTILKGELGFKGFVQSDWGATPSTAKAVNAGLDMDMPGDINFDGDMSQTYFGKNLTKAVENKQVAESRATDMATRIVAAWYKMRQDESFPKNTMNATYPDSAPVVNVQANHKKLVREMGAASSVLLKNTKSALPIDPKKVKKIALIGSDAGSDPYGLNQCEYNTCDNGTLAMGWGSGSATFPYLVTPLAGLTEAFGKKVKIESYLNDWDLTAAANAAEGADYALVFSNSDSGEYIASIDETSVDGNAGDRNNLTLWNNGDNLVCIIQ